MAEPTQPNPAEVYEAFIVPVLFVPWTKELLGRVDPRPGHRVLDVACGTGIVARTVAPLVGSGGRVVGLDPSPGMLAVARSLPAPAGLGIEWVEGRAEALPLPDDAFDLVTCQQGLQFVPDRSAALREMRRVTASGGRIGVAVWESFERNPFYAGLDELAVRRTGEHYFDRGFSMLGPAKVRSLLEGAGWRDVAGESVELMVHAPSSATFVRLTLVAASAVVTADEPLAPAEREALFDGMLADAADLIARFADGEGATYPMVATIATAVA